MSGSTIGGLAGGAIGFIVGGPAGAQWGFMIGSAVGGYVDPQRIEGPRLTDAQTQTSMEGVPRTIVYGTCAVAGNLIQWGPLVEHKRTERQGKGGPKVTTYTYTRTIAIRICEAAPLGGAMKLRRVWMDDKLVYDVSEGSVMTAESQAFASILTFYDGSEDQLPDPSLEALDEEYGGGVGNVPAYRGTCYAVLTDLDCTDRQGSVPQFRWEVCSDATEVVETGNIPSLDPDDPDLLFWWPLDDATRDGTARELVNGYDGAYSDTAGVSSGPALRAGSGGSLRMATKNDNMSIDLSTVGGSAGFLGRNEWTLACYLLLEDDVGNGSVAKVAAVNWSGPSSGEKGWQISFPPSNNRVYGAWNNGSGGGGINVVTQNPTETYQQAIRVVVTYSASAGKRKLYVNGVLVKEESAVPPTFNGRYIGVGGAYFPNSYGFVGCVSDVQGWKRCFTADEVASDSLLMGSVFEAPDGDGIFVRPNGDVLYTVRRTVTPGMVSLPSVVADIASRAGIDSDQLYLSALTGMEVRGYPVARQTTADAAIRELQQVFFFDLPEWGNSGDTGTKLRAVLRGGASVLTLTDDDLVDNDDDEDTRPQQVEYPRKVWATAADPDANYEAVSEPAERETENVKAVGEVRMATSVVLVRDEIKQLAEKSMKTRWAAAEGRTTQEVIDALSQYTPSDVITFNDKRYRIDRTERRDGSVVWEMERDRASAATSTATGSGALSPTTPTGTVRGPTIFQALNLPSLRSADNVPGVYIAAQGLLPGWIGADIYLSVDGGVTEQKVATITDPATIGVLAEDTDADGNDTSGLISVTLYKGGELDSITEAQMDARLNGFALTTSGVSEVGQFQYADETSTPRLYDLSNVERGQLGTTAAAHNSGDRFVLLDGAVLFVPIDAQFASQTLIFRAVSIGTAPANNPTTSIVFDPPTFIVDGGEVTP